jgi:hypothetical protein
MACESGSDSGKIGVLFSGGIDSVLLTAVLHTVLAPHLSIDLLNVTFIKSTLSAMESSVSGVQERDSPSALLHGHRTTITVDDAPSPDRLAAIAAYLELQVIYLPFQLLVCILLIRGLSFFRSDCSRSGSGGWCTLMWGKASVLNTSSA